ncbi:MAG: hypothetical protein H6739_00290 [Alphaproteobacteria bacterium]|nr:hypothetical protein [Alphaproteobacteria bacterium]
MYVLLMALACTGEDPDDTTLFLLPERGTGTALATGSGMDLSTPQAAFFAAGHVAQEIDARWGFPATQIPLLLWEDVLLGENIADPGSCPYSVADGPETTWRTGCRSQDGYTWAGEVSKTTWEEDETGDWLHYTFDIDVSSDNEGRAFDRIAMSGEFYYLNGDSEPLARYAEANLRVEAEGYWAHNFEDALEDAWSDLALTGRWQTLDEDGDAVHAFEAAADLGAYGGFAASTGELVDSGSCVAEPEGSIALEGDQSARLDFEGRDRCDGCAEFYLDGARGPNACRGL